jgi:peptidoglycan/xylan/chitin deacetylase (PgdA/CDA1 family)
MLNAEELRRLDAAGMEIGSHGVTHVRFPKLSDTELRDELHQSKQTLEDLLGKPVDSLAYPYGAWDERCETAVRDAGYRSACTTRTGPALKDRNLYRLRRIEVVNHDSAARLARKLTLLTNEGGWPHLLGYFGKQAIRRVLPDRIRS